MRCCKYRVYLRKFQIFKRKSLFFNISGVSSVHYLPSDFTAHENASKTFVHAVLHSKTYGFAVRNLWYCSAKPMLLDAKTIGFGDDSQRGNTLFPPWEHFVPSMGINAVNKCWLLTDWIKELDTKGRERRDKYKKNVKVRIFHSVLPFFSYFCKENKKQTKDESFYWQ